MLRWFVYAGDILALSVKACRLCQLSQRESLWRNRKLYALTRNFAAMPRPLPLGEVDLRSKDGEGEVGKILLVA